MTAYDFSAGDIFELAVDIEVNGTEFYTKAAEQVTDPSHKQLLQGLAKMEVEHKKTFEQMRKELAEKEKSAPVFDPEGDAAAYLQALADIRVFFDKEIDTSTMKNILMAAITAEKDSIVLYLGMKELVPEKFGRNRIDAIIKEEMKHIRMLSAELKKQKA